MIDTAEQSNRVNIIAEKIRTNGSAAIVVTNFPFLCFCRRGGPKEFVNILQTKHHTAYKKLQSIMNAWL